MLTVLAGVVTALGVVADRAEQRARMAEQQTRTAQQFATESEVERGQQALLHGESSEAVRYLEQA